MSRPAPRSGRPGRHPAPGPSRPGSRTSRKRDSLAPSSLRSLGGLVVHALPDASGPLATTVLRSLGALAALGALALAGACSAPRAPATTPAPTHPTSAAAATPPRSADHPQTAPAAEPAPAAADPAPAASTATSGVPLANLHAANRATAAFTPVSPRAAELFAPHLRVGPTAQAPAVDGDLSDPVWEAVPPRRFLASVSGAAPQAATQVRVAYDDANLYLAIRAFEQGQETQRHAAVPRDDDAVFAGDAVEIFLQPGGTGAPYYQIVAGTRGALWDERWNAPGQRSGWSGTGIRAAGAEQPDTWTLEVAIPFAELGTRPRPGQVWRFNACRTEQPGGEYTCWSPTRGGYHLTARYGYLEFAERPETAAAVAGTRRATGLVIEPVTADPWPPTVPPATSPNVRGSVTPKDAPATGAGGPADGGPANTGATGPGGAARPPGAGAGESPGSSRPGFRPVIHVAARTPFGTARTDSQGVFRLDGLPPGPLALRIDSPRYRVWSARFTADEAREILPPIHLQRVDPYLPAYQLPRPGPPGDNGASGAAPGLGRSSGRSDTAGGGGAEGQGFAARGSAAPTPTVTWLASSLEEPPDMTHAPTAGQRAAGLDLLAAPGEIESGAVAFYAHADLITPRVASVRLVGPAGPREALAARVRWTQRLLTRVQYTRAPEDAVFTWRYLWPDSPARIRAGQVRQLVLTVRVPDHAPPGTYRGELVLGAGQDPAATPPGTDPGRRSSTTADLLAGPSVPSQSGGDPDAADTIRAEAGLAGDDGPKTPRTVARLPVTLQVAPFDLVEPAKRVGCYYRGRRPDDQVRRELLDIHDHGGRVLVWAAGIVYGRDEEGHFTWDTRRVERAVRLQHEAGIGPPFIVGTSPRRASALAGLRVQMSPDYAAALDTSRAFRHLYGEGIRRLQALERRLGAGEFVFTWMDEVFGRGRLEPWLAIARLTRQRTDHRIYITLHNRDQALVERADPYVDVRGYHGHTLDWWLGQGHTFEELAAELGAAGDEAWTYYNIRGVEVTPEWVRLTNGYWLWRSPLSAHTPWIYYAVGNSPFDDLDSPRHDFAYAAPHPTRPEMVSSLEWEAFREGWNDLHYLATLQQAVDRAAARAPDARSPAPGTAAPESLAGEALRQARRLLETWWDQDPRVPVQAARLTAADYQGRKRAMTRAIQALEELGL